MDKNLIIKLLRNYAVNSSDEAKEIIALKARYPYSQVLHAISAKVSKDQGLGNHQDELQLAAVYSSDRSVLKEIMTKIESFAVEKQEEIRSQESRIQADTEPSVAYTLPSQPTKPTFDLADTVLKDLQRLVELKHNFEILFADKTAVSFPDFNTTHTPPPVSNISTPTIGNVSTPISTPTSQSKPKPTKAVKEENAKTKESAKSRKERIIALAKAVNTNPDKTNDDESANSKTESSRKKKKVNPGDELIEEIKTTKEELEIENDKQKEQIEIIDHFIKIQPSITSARERNPPPLNDFSGIKSGEFGENIVSETLVEILIKQGKKDKAIEVLKKLIWKYPQKKAQYAEQIESLRDTP